MPRRYDPTTGQQDRWRRFSEAIPVPETRLVSTASPITGGGALTSDVTISHANSGVAAATYGSATTVPQIAVDVTGHITSASNITITGVPPGGAAGGDLSGTYPNPSVVDDSHNHAISSTITGLGSGVATFLGTPSSANLATAVTDETGSGALVFGTAPTLDAPSVTTSLDVQGPSSSVPLTTFDITGTCTSPDQSAIGVFADGLTVGANATVRAVVVEDDNPFVVTANPNALGAFDFFVAKPIIQNDTSTAISMAGINGLWMGPTIRSDNANLTLTDAVVPAVGGLHFTPIFSSLGGATDTATDVGAVRATANVGSSWTLDKLFGLEMLDPTNAGTITELLAIEIQDLTQGGTNMSLRSAGSGVTMRHAGSANFGATDAPTGRVDIEAGTSIVDLLRINATGTRTALVTGLDLYADGVTVGSGGQVTGVACDSASVITVGASATLGNFFAFNPAVRNAASTAVTLGAQGTLGSAPTIGSNSAAITWNDFFGIIPSLSAVYFSPTLNRFAGSANSTATSIYGLHTVGNVAAGWTVTDFKALNMNAPAVGGTITNLIGVDIADIGGLASTINCSFRSLGTAVDMRHAGPVRIGTTGAPSGAILDVFQPSTSAAIPVVSLDQADVDEPFVKFVGDAASATLTRDLVAVADVSTFTPTGYVKVEIQDDGNQIADGDYYIQVGTLA